MHARRLTVLAFVLVCLFISFPVASSPALAARLSLVVNDPGDSSDYQINGVCETAPGNGICTLRAAVEEVNAAGGGLHTISIGAMAITLSDQAVTKPLVIQRGVILTIRGAGINSTFLNGSYNPPFRVFQIQPRAILTLRHVAFYYGNSVDRGGCILNNGTLITDHVYFSGCWTQSPDGTFGGQGGAIYNQHGAVAIIMNTTFYSNYSRLGGAIFNAGWLSVTNSTFSYNRAELGEGAGSYNVGYAALLNTTFAENFANKGGGIANGGGRFVISSSTIASNGTNAQGGGIYNGGGQVILQNTIVAHNWVAKIPMGDNCAGPIVSKGFNLSNDFTCNLRARGDQPGVWAYIGGLGDYGGPTLTYELQPNSPAIDAGFCVAGVDQRGDRRPVNLPQYPDLVNGCDIGAFEVQQ